MSQKVQRAALAASIGRPCRFVGDATLRATGPTRYDVTVIIYEPEPIFTGADSMTPWHHQLRVAAFEGDKQLSNAIFRQWFTADKDWTNIRAARRSQ